MTIKVFISGICGSHDVRKTQQRVLFILSTLPVDLEIIDVTEPGREQERALMQEEVRKHNKKDILPPQIFNGDQYCGNYDDFQLAADDDVLMSFLKLEEASSKTEISNSNEEVKKESLIHNGVNHDHDASEKSHQMDEEQEDAEVIPTGEKNVTDDSMEISVVEPILDVIGNNEEDKINVEEKNNDVEVSSAQEIEQGPESITKEQEVSEEEEASSEEEESD